MIITLHNTVQPADWIQIMLTAGLVGITAFYAAETRRQAMASVKSVETIQEQTLIQSRPVVIQKVERYTLDNMYPGVSEKDTKIVRSEYFSNFVIMNVGNGPAIELEISLLSKDKRLLVSHRETFLKPDQEYLPDINIRSFEKGTYYLVCEYHIAFPVQNTPTWQQTWLPFDLSEALDEGKRYVGAGELDFRAVSAKDRIAAFTSKPK